MEYGFYTAAVTDTMYTTTLPTLIKPGVDNETISVRKDFETLLAIRAMSHFTDEKDTNPTMEWQYNFVLNPAVMEWFTGKQADTIFVEMTASTYTGENSTPNGDNMYVVSHDLGGEAMNLLFSSWSFQSNLPSTTSGVLVWRALFTAAITPLTQSVRGKIVFRCTQNRYPKYYYLGGACELRFFTHTYSIGVRATKKNGELLRAREELNRSILFSDLPFHATPLKAPRLRKIPHYAKCARQEVPHENFEVVENPNRD